MTTDLIDETKLAAIKRLTPAERECLRRCLEHQTAKQMAIDLGVSAHAVEKRLKMARAKLGLSWTCLGKVESSLEVKGELNDEAATVHEGV